MNINKGLKVGLAFFALVGLFTFIALIDLQEADAAKASKVRTWKYGSKTKGIVCGDKLCSEKIGLGK
jgi:hypothetical protein